MKKKVVLTKDDYTKDMNTLEPLCKELADNVCRTINERCPSSSGSVKYARQASLERVIEILNERV